MYINDVAPGSKVHVTVAIGVNKLEFDTESIQGLILTQRGIVVHPIMRDGKIINFNVGGIVIKAFIYNEGDKMPYEWINVKIKKIKQKNDTNHIIFCEKDVPATNRREHYRVWLGLDAVAQVGTNREPYDVTIKDISAKGIAFIIRNDVEIHDGTLVHLSFYDEPSGTKFSIAAIVVRQQEIDLFRNLYGCRLNAESVAINRFIQQKQRERAKLDKKERKLSK